jgi:hypothetical protein
VLFERCSSARAVVSTEADELHGCSVDEDRGRPDAIGRGAGWMDDLLTLERRIEIVDFECDVREGLDGGWSGLSGE